MEDTVWLVAITFLTIGYGDLTPKTTCGKTICLLTGVMGVGCTAMLVAVVSNKLVLNKARAEAVEAQCCLCVIRNAAANVLRECWLLHRSSRGRRHGGEHRRDQRRLLKAIQVAGSSVNNTDLSTTERALPLITLTSPLQSWLFSLMGVGCTAMLVAVVSNKLVLNKAEKHVHQFMMDTKDTKKIRNAAANVLRECWLLHRSSRGRRHGGEHRRDQRRLLKAIQVFRNARIKQRKKTDHGNKMVDLLKHLQRITCDLNANWSNSYKELEQRINSMEQKMDALRIAFHDISQPLSRAVQHRAEDYSLT
ncbi:UNVERIFIED_CONTAM: hypothetical protein FKN15_032663 [Acipenser sinensis]